MNFLPTEPKVTGPDACSPCGGWGCFGSTIHIGTTEKCRDCNGSGSNKEDSA